MSVVVVSKKVPRQRFPESFADQDAFVCERLQAAGGLIVYQKLNTRRALCEKFDVCKRGFQALCITINRLVESGQVRRDEVETRSTERYCGFVNPASRQITLSLVRF